MARTKASVGAKVSTAKSSKARSSVTQTSSSSSSSGKGERSSRGLYNPVCPRPTPKWQKPISQFLIGKSSDKHNVSDSEGDSDASSKGSTLLTIDVSDSEETDSVDAEKSKPEVKVPDASSKERTVLTIDVSDSEETDSVDGEKSKPEVKVPDASSKERTVLTIDVSDSEETDSVDGEKLKPEVKVPAKVSKRRISRYDSDEEVMPDLSEMEEKPVNTALDETFELQLLTGEESHKIDEYYRVQNCFENRENLFKNKGKGKGKKSKTVGNNNDDSGKKLFKRDRDSNDEEEIEQTKKVKLM